MATPNLDSLFPLLMPELPECPFDTVRLAVRRACRTFCRESTAWRVLLTPIPMEEGVGSYALTLPPNTELVTICNVYAPVGELSGKALDQLRLILPDWATAIGSPSFFNTLDYATLRLYPAPSAHYVGALYTPRVALMTTLAAQDLPAELTVRYDEALAAGALSHLLATIGRPWSNPARAAQEKTAFASAIAAARIAIEHERVKGNIRVQPREFGR